MSEQLYRKATNADWDADKDKTMMWGVPVEPDQEVRTSDGKLLGVIIFNDAGRAHYDNLELKGADE